MRNPVFALGALLMLPIGLANAQVATGTRPKDATALCKDGTFYSGSDQANACKGNGGLQEWWGRNVAPKEAPASKEPATKPTPRTDTREPYDKAEHPKPVAPPAGAS